MRRAYLCNVRSVPAPLLCSSRYVSAVTLGRKINYTNLQAFLHSPTPNPDAERLLDRPLVVPHGMQPMGVRSSAAVVETLAVHYAEKFTLHEMAQFHRAVLQRTAVAGDASRSPGFYDSVLLHGFGSSLGSTAAVSSSVAAVSPESAVSSSASEERTATDAKGKAAAVKSTFNVKLASFDASIKIKLIKELRTVTNLPLAEAKGVIDKCPGLVASNMGKEDAERLKTLFESHGATVELL